MVFPQKEHNKIPKNIIKFFFLKKKNGPSTFLLMAKWQATNPYVLFLNKRKVNKIVLSE